jgi:hypothetical protein
VANLSAASGLTTANGTTSAHADPARIPSSGRPPDSADACAWGHAWSPALAAAWGWSVVEVLSASGSGVDVMGD